MTFTFRPAVRENVHLLLGIAGGTGSGKTYSALLVAKGLAQGKRFAGICSENGRMLHYADFFDFDYADLQPPFTPQRYVEAIQAADAAGYPVIVVDQVSHEHEGDGGLLDLHEAELDRMAGDDWKKREAVKMAAWIKPKTAHKELVQALLRVKAHVILCFRAAEKIEMARENGKTVIRPKTSPVGADGWMPIAEKNLPYEMTLSVLLKADRPGVPIPIKLQEQHRAAVPLDQPLTEETGRALALWAAGAKPADSMTADDALLSKALKAINATRTEEDLRKLWPTIRVAETDKAVVTQAFKNHAESLKAPKT